MKGVVREFVVATAFEEKGVTRGEIEDLSILYSNLGHRSPGAFMTLIFFGHKVLRSSGSTL